MNRELTYNKWIKYIHDYQLNKNTEMEKKKMKMSDVLKIYPMQLEWYNYFVDYILEQDPNLYNKACEYANYEEKQNLITVTDEQIKQMRHIFYIKKKKLFLNSIENYKLEYPVVCNCKKRGMRVTNL